MEQAVVRSGSVLPTLKLVLNRKKIGFKKMPPFEKGGILMFRSTLYSSFISSLHYFSLSNHPAFSLLMRYPLGVLVRYRYQGLSKVCFYIGQE